MPTPTYTPLANITLGSSASTVTFTSISASYRDLVLVITGTTVNLQGVTMKFNADSGNNYYEVGMDGYGSGSPASFSATSSYVDSGSFSSTLSSSNIQILDYSATDKHKPVLVRTDNSSWGTRALAARWANTSAINSITMFTTGTGFLTGTTMALFGIAS